MFLPQLCVVERNSIALFVETALKKKSIKYTVYIYNIFSDIIHVNVVWGVCFSAKTFGQSQSDVPTAASPKSMLDSPLIWLENDFRSFENIPVRRHGDLLPMGQQCRLHASSSA